jgi:hypothetical protein
VAWLHISKLSLVFVRIRFDQTGTFRWNVHGDRRMHPGLHGGSPFPFPPMGAIRRCVRAPARRTRRFLVLSLGTRARAPLFPRANVSVRQYFVIGFPKRFPPLMPPFCCIWRAYLFPSLYRPTRQGGDRGDVVPHVDASGRHAAPFARKKKGGVGARSPDTPVRSGPLRRRQFPDPSLLSGGRLTLSRALRGRLPPQTKVRSVLRNCSVSVGWTLGSTLCV